MKHRQEATEGEKYGVLLWIIKEVSNKWRSQPSEADKQMDGWWATSPFKVFLSLSTINSMAAGDVYSHTAIS